MREIKHIYEVFNPQFWLIKEKKMLKWGNDVVSMSTSSITTREDVDWDGSVGKSRTIQLVSDYPESKVQWIMRRNTGLKDKNGLEIYEGDILEQNNGNEIFKFAVEWRDNQFTVGYNIGTKEVIGNIYENPELLTAEVKTLRNKDNDMWPEVKNANNKV